MEQITLKLPGKYLEGLDSLILDGVYYCRSEAVRSAVRTLLKWEGAAYFSKIQEFHHNREEKEFIQTKRGDTCHKIRIHIPLPPKEVIQFFLQNHGEPDCHEITFIKDTDNFPAKMKSIQVKLPETLINSLDILVKIGLYPSRSKAIRVAIRNFLKRERNFPFSKIYEALSKLDRYPSSLSPQGKDDRN